MNELADNEFHQDDNDKSTKENLPIFAFKDEIIEAVKNNQFVIIHGQTGCGKTTQVPQYLFEAGLHGDLNIGITQPRRIAALSMAKRVAQEMSVPIGKLVGYEIRFDKKCEASTKIKYMTDGILLNECIVNKRLNEYGIIMIDEAHERAVVSDVLLGLLKLIATKKREDLKVIISSATISVEKFVTYFNNAKVVSVETRLHRVDIIYHDLCQDYIQKTAEIVHDIHQRNLQMKGCGNAHRGDVLVFLPGQEEILLCCEELGKIHDVAVRPLYSTIDFQSQQEVFEQVRPYETKVVVATNIAETSITIEGIRYVIDCGYVKQNRFNASRHMEVLEDVRISKAQAKQREGRAGRTQDGVCYRLYQRATYESFKDEATPEIYRKNLAHVCMMLRAVPLNPHEFPFLDPPEPKELQRSEKELYDLNLMNADGKLTAMGDSTALLPLEPVLGKILMTSISNECTTDVICIVAMFSEKMQNIFKRSRKNAKMADAKKSAFHDPSGDHFMLLKIYTAWKKEKDRKKWCEENYIDSKTMNGIDSAIDQIQLILKRKGIRIPKSKEDSKIQIKKSFVAGYFRNICIKQPRDVYLRVWDEEIFYIYGNSCLKESRPKIILFHDAIKSTKSFASGVMQLDEGFLRQHYPKELDLIKFPKDINAPQSF